ncbi:MAG: O-antigen ligase family protein [Bacteriovoracia bacterium]
MSQRISFFSIAAIGLLLGASFAVFPGVGDEIREPKWIWLLASSAVLLLANFRLAAASVRSLAHDYLALIFFCGIFLHACLRPNGWAAMAFVFGFLLLWIATRSLRAWMRGEGKQSLLWLGASLTLLNAAFAFLQVAQLDPVFGLKDPAYIGSPSGFLGHHTIFGAWMAMMAAWHLGRREWKLFFVAAVCVCISSSAFSFASLCAVLAVWAFVKTSWRRSLFLAYALGAAALLFAVSTASPESFFFENGRFFIWGQTLSAISERPVLGYGLLSFSSLFSRYHQGFAGGRFLQAHNELLQWVYETGFFGLAILSPLLARVFTGIQRSWKDPARLSALLAFTALSVNAFGNFTLHIAPLALGWLLAVHDLGDVSGERQGIS